MSILTSEVCGAQKPTDHRAKDGSQDEMFPK